MPSGRAKSATGFTPSRMGHKAAKMQRRLPVKRLMRDLEKAISPYPQTPRRRKGR